MLGLRGMPHFPRQQKAIEHIEGEWRRAKDQLAEAVMMERRTGAGINTNGVTTEALMSDGMFRE